MEAAEGGATSPLADDRAAGEEDGDVAGAEVSAVGVVLAAGSVSGGPAMLPIRKSPSKMLAVTTTQRRFQNGVAGAGCGSGGSCGMSMVSFIGTPP
ncbi:hypothetical protein GCU56_03755 [Geodermatophilus sabuli]|uniref:Uncharacterized protein n=1 Tax=Geodermatophilus sabuli TaxID=1564158 RepID=A0A7K3VWG1_9ACTN|nr:hypothetical protein [Geodermatophilus sabuli]